MATPITGYVIDKPMDQSGFIGNQYDMNMTESNAKPYYKNMLWVLLIVSIIVLLVIVHWNMFRCDKFEPAVVMEPPPQDLTDPLTKCGWEVYVTPTCPYCIKQREILSQHFPTFKNIFTDRPVQAVPTWYNVNTKQSIPGMQSYEKLLEMAKC